MTVGLEAKRAHKAELDALPEQYYQEEFNSVLSELQQLPPYFTKEDLDAVVDARASVLEVSANAPVCLEGCTCRLTGQLLSPSLGARVGTTAN